MSQQPKTETDRLANVIQVLQLGYKTGRLIVERNEGAVFEQGFITFVNGQIIQASVNQQQGPDALGWLRSWGHCRFTFSSEMSGIVNQSPNLAPHVQTSENLINGNTSSLFSNRTPADIPRFSHNPSVRTTSKLGEQRTPTAWLSIPYRTRQLEEGMRLIEHMGLSRTHRRLFLLIDGRRAIKELIRLMTHEPEEVLRLLQDLEHAGVIQI